MIKLLHCLLLLTAIHQSTQYSVYSARHSSPLSAIELALKEYKITLDELIAETGDSNHENNEISQLNPLFEPHNVPATFGLFHKEPDYDWNAQQMIENRGFKFEAHHVVTEDCYVLEMHRIVRARLPNFGNQLCKLLLLTFFFFCLQSAGKSI